jgi:hypothetical protein
MGIGYAGALEVGSEGIGRCGAVVEGHIQHRHGAAATEDDGGQQGSLQTG